MKYLPQFYISEYRKSLFLLKKSFLYPSFANLKQYYNDNITVSIPYKHTIVKQSLGSLVVDNVKLSFDILCIYSCTEKILKIYFKWNSSVDTDSLVLNSIEYFTGLFFYIQKELAKNEIHVFTIDVSSTNHKYTLQDTLKYHVTYKRHKIFAPPQHITYTSHLIYGFYDIIDTSILFKSSVKSEVHTLSNKFARIMYKTPKYENIDINIQYPSNSQTLEISANLYQLQPYYMKVANDTIAIDVPYKTTTNTTNYSSILSWITQS